MGAAASSTNQSFITNNTSINDSEACNTSQLVYVNNGPVTVLNSGIEGNLTINSTDATEEANCNFNTQITALAKATADQTADSSADTGLPVALDFAMSDSSNVVNLQNNIEMAVNSACGAQQTVTVSNTSVVLNGDVVKGAADINQTNSAVNSTCVMDLVQQSSEVAQATQTASATATNTDLGMLLLIIGAVLLGGILVLGVGKAIFKAVFKAPASAASAVGKSGTTASQRLANAQAQLAAAKAAKAKASASAPPPSYGPPPPGYGPAPWGAMEPWGAPPGMAPSMAPGMAGPWGMPWGGPWGAPPPPAFPTAAAPPAVAPVAA